MIVLGADVGKATGLVVLDCSGARPRYLAAALGRDTLVEVTQTIFRAHDIVLVGIETPAQVFEHGRAAESEGARRSIERALLVARDAAGQVRAVASMSGAEVHDGQAHHVRRAVLGKLPKTGVDRFIASRLPLLVDGWPARSNDHERDAAIVALWAWQRAKVGLKPGESAPSRKAKRGRPTVGDLRTAAERAFNRAGVSKESRERIMSDAAKLQADPGEERAACMLVPCPGCCAAAGKPCTGLGAGGIVYGVHPPRAVAAGITGVQVPRAEPRAPTGPRKLATVRPLECWARLPWAKPCGPCMAAPWVAPCATCGDTGTTLVHWAAVEKEGAPAEVAFPLEERRRSTVTHGEVCGACAGSGRELLAGHGDMGPCDACQGHGRVLRMIRRPWRRAGVECWLYEPAT